jgi:iron complex transport system permease protein
MGRNSIYLAVLLPVLLFFLITGLKVGSVDSEYQEVWEALMAYNHDNTLHSIIVNLRMPRVLVTFLAGSALALSGYLMQAMVNNPLADPYILGSASGASLGVNLATLGIFPSFFTDFIPSSLFAFGGAVFVTLLAMGVAYDKGHINPSRLLLTGVGLSSLMVALTTLLIYTSASDIRLKKVVFWSMGSLEQASWEKIPYMAGVIFACTVFYSLMGRHLNILLLGESRASSLGVNIVVLRWVILCGASLATAVAVAVAGPVGFVGLMIPHFVRGISGVHSKFNVIYTVLTGGVFLLICDTLTRVLFPGADLPIGIITSFLGIPFFVYLLTKRNYRFS